jgi:geranylgeranyl diphosphate synthase type I
VTESTRLVDLVDSRVDEFLITREPIVTLISRDLTPLVDFSRQFLSGGKRFRALFCYWGWQSVRGDDIVALAPVVSAAAALEIFHAAALVHDDIIDNSDTRRGGSSAHKLFESLHRSEGWAGGAGDFGRASAILLGDLLLGWSDELLDEGLLALPLEAGAAARRARLEFNHMRTEVTAGQYLDILEEQAWIVQPESELLERALRVITFKSAKYSVQAPLVIGAALAGGSPAQLDVLRAFGLPLGIAYQLRDDLLGVFGDAVVTGKPSGDDLREGKRTVLVALARQTLTPGERALLDAELGDPTLDATRIGALQQLILASGAVERVETMITDRVAEAEAVLEGSPLAAAARAQLSALSAKVTRRAF